MKIANIISATNIDPDVYKTAVIIIVIIIVMSFVLTVLRTILAHRLRNKMLEKGISESLVASILQKDANSAKHLSVKWMLLLMTAGIGVFVTSYFSPLGIHSFGIMAISLATGFLLNILYLKYFSK